MQDKDIPQLIAHIEAQGSLLRMKLVGQQSRPGAWGHKRGIIRAFSRGARLRLMRFLARLKTRKIRATFITLTFSKVVTNEQAKKCFKRFYMRLTRKFQGSSGVWRMEFQERGAIHFHILCFNLPFWKQADLQSAWESCTGEDRSISHIRLVHGARSVMAYIAKYIAKVDDRSPTSLDDDTYQHAEGKERSIGRCWGYINKERLPLGEVVAGVLTDRQTIKSLSSFIWALLRSDNPYNSLSFHYFCDNARWICERAIEEGGCWLDEWEYATKDHTAHNEPYSPYTEHFSSDELSPKERLSLGKLLKGERSELVQPLTAEWLKPASLSFVARVLADFREQGTIVYIAP